MSKVKGTVTGCGKGKYSFFVTLDSKDGFYYNTKYEPKCGKGDVVGIEYEQKASNRGNVKKIVVLEKNSNGYEDTYKGGSGGGGGSPSGGGISSPDRQDSIMWQSSRKDAIQLATLLVQSEAIKLPKNPDARRNAIEPLIDELTFRYFEDASNPKKSKAYTEASGIEEDAEEPESEDEGGDWDGDESEKKEDSWDDWDD